MCHYLKLKKISGFTDKKCIDNNFKWKNNLIPSPLLFTELLFLIKIGLNHFDENRSFYF